jgi:4-alpha-glucanotransferase
MRIDHAMGLNRLWVIPDGAVGSEGAYLDFPERDLIRLITLESHVHRAIVLAEDLGTVPDGFQDRLRDAGIAGMRVLWFERDHAQHFIPPAHWTQRAAAMTSTHDLATLAGWWQGNDIAWREKLGHVPDPAAAHAERAHEKNLLWKAIQQSGAAHGDAPDNPATFADAAIDHVGRSACELVMLPIEDALALPEQPNLPGTIDEHPNWRRRLDTEARNCLDDDATEARLTALQRARQGK